MRRTGDSGPRMDQIHLNLNLSPPRARAGSADRSRTSSSDMSSCVSSEFGQEEASSAYVAGASEEEEEVVVVVEAAATTMILAGCPRCLMYVMLVETETEPRCPRCKGSVLLDLQGKTQSTRRG